MRVSPGVVAAVALTLPGLARGDFLFYEGFETYADTAELEAAWVDVSGSPVQTLETSPLPTFSKSLRLEYDVSDGVDDEVELTFPEPLFVDVHRTLIVFFRGDPGNTPGGRMVARLVGPGGTETELLPGTTKALAEPLHFDAALFRSPRSSLRLGVLAHEGGSGVVWFDAISIAGGTYGSCRSCHGAFDEVNHRAFDRAFWESGLMSVHTDMLGDCRDCHAYSFLSPSDFYPVFLDSSANADPGSCIDCHGREEDEGNDDISLGWGAGLRQHHARVRTGNCDDCHSDAPVTAFEPIDENVLPSHYTLGGSVDDPCDGSELFESPIYGLDNDGDHLFEWEDYACWATAQTDVDADGLVLSVDPCPEFPNTVTSADANQDGVPNGCQCADANEDGDLTIADVSALSACIAAGTGCNPDLADANGDGALTAADPAALGDAVAGTVPNSSLTCARRPDGVSAAHAFGLLQRAAGDATLDVVAGDLVVGNVGSDGMDGLAWQLGETPEQAVTIAIADVDPTDSLPDGASLRTKFVGVVEGAPGQIALLTMEKVGTEFELSMNASTLGATTYRYAVYLAGALVAASYSEVAPAVSDEPIASWRLETVAGSPNAIAHAHWGAPVNITLPDVLPVVGDELQIAPDDATETADGIAIVDVRIADIPDVTILGVSTAVQVPLPSWPGAALIVVTLGGLGWGTLRRGTPR